MLHMTGSRRLEGTASLVISTKDMSVGVENGIRGGGVRGSKDLETARQGSGTGAPSGYLPSSEL